MRKIDTKISTKYDTPSERITIHPHLMKVPFYLTSVGKGMSGKSVWIANVVHMYKDVFKDGRILLFTDSDCDTIMNLRRTRKVKIFDNLYDAQGENIVQKLLNFQKERKEQIRYLKEKGMRIEHPLEHYLVIFDDFITSKDLNARRGIFTKLFSQARHYQISIILTSQEYMLLPAPVRKLSQYNIFYKVFKENERQKIIEENHEFLSPEEFETMWDFATDKPYNFLMCDVDNRRFLHNFDYIMKEYKG